jgi:hypothetical protein
MKNLAVVLTAAVSLIGCGGNAIAPTTGDASIGTRVVSGTVVAVSDSGTRSPLRGATILATNGHDQRSAHSDGAGRFELDSLTTGDWTITATKTGFVMDAKRVSLSSGDAAISFELVVDDRARSPERPGPAQVKP